MIYPIYRFLYHVYVNSEVGCPQIDAEPEHHFFSPLDALPLTSVANPGQG